MAEDSSKSAGPIRRVCLQKGKICMLGATPRHGFTVPESSARIIVDQPALDALRSQIPISRRDSTRWVDHVFEYASREAYHMIGEPLNSLSLG